MDSSTYSKKLIKKEKEKDNLSINYKTSDLLDSSNLSLTNFSTIKENLELNPTTIEHKQLSNLCHSKYNTISLTDNINNEKIDDLGKIYSRKNSAQRLENNTSTSDINCKGCGNKVKFDVDKSNYLNISASEKNFCMNSIIKQAKMDFLNHSTSREKIYLKSKNYSFNYNSNNHLNNSIYNSKSNSMISVNVNDKTQILNVKGSKFPPNIPKQTSKPIALGSVAAVEEISTVAKENPDKDENLIKKTSVCLTKNFKIPSWKVANSTLQEQNKNIYESNNAGSAKLINPKKIDSPKNPSIVASPSERIYPLKLSLDLNMIETFSSDKAINISNDSNIVDNFEKNSNGLSKRNQNDNIIVLNNNIVNASVQRNTNIPDKDTSIPNDIIKMQSKENSTKRNFTTPGFTNDIAVNNRERKIEDPNFTDLAESREQDNKKDKEKETTKFQGAKKQENFMDSLNLNKGELQHSNILPTTTLNNYASLGKIPEDSLSEIYQTKSNIKEKLDKMKSLIHNINNTNSSKNDSKLNNSSTITSDMIINPYLLESKFKNLNTVSKANTETVPPVRVGKFVLLENQEGQKRIENLNDDQLKKLTFQLSSNNKICNNDINSNFNISNKYNIYKENSYNNINNPICNKNKNEEITQSLIELGRNKSTIINKNSNTETNNRLSSNNSNKFKSLLNKTVKNALNISKEENKYIEKDKDEIKPLTRVEKIEDILNTLNTDHDFKHNVKNLIVHDNREKIRNKQLFSDHLIYTDLNELKKLHLKDQRLNFSNKPEAKAKDNSKNARKILNSQSILNQPKETTSNNYKGVLGIKHNKHNTLSDADRSIIFEYPNNTVKANTNKNIFIPVNNLEAYQKVLEQSKSTNRLKERVHELENSLIKSKIKSKEALKHIMLGNNQFRDKQDQQIKEILTKRGKTLSHDFNNRKSNQNSQDKEMSTFYQKFISNNAKYKQEIQNLYGDYFNFMDTKGKTIDSRSLLEKSFRKNLTKQ